MEPLPFYVFFQPSFSRSGIVQTQLMRHWKDDFPPMDVMHDVSLDAVIEWCVENDVVYEASPRAGAYGRVAGGKLWVTDQRAERVLLVTLRWL